jgi:hypothetical protein
LSPHGNGGVALVLVARLSVLPPSQQARSMITEDLRAYTTQIFREKQKFRLSAAVT